MNNKIRKNQLSAGQLESTGRQLKEDSQELRDPSQASVPEFAVNEDGVVNLVGVDEDAGEVLSNVASTFGIENSDAAMQLLAQVAGLDEDFSTKPDKVNRLISLIHELAPRDAIEALLISQMVATQGLAMDCAHKANLSEQTFEGQELNLNYSVKLMRAFTAQMEALNKHRGKGQQKMTVEHVHVNEGGQAVIGNVEGGSTDK